MYKCLKQPCFSHLLYTRKRSGLQNTMAMLFADTQSITYYSVGIMELHAGVILLAWLLDSLSFFNAARASRYMS